MTHIHDWKQKFLKVSPMQIWETHWDYAGSQRGKKKECLHGQKSDYLSYFTQMLDIPTTPSGVIHGVQRIKL